MFYTHREYRQPLGFMIRFKILKTDNSKLQIVYCIGLFFAVSFLVVLPFFIYPERNPHDFKYHLAAIRSIVNLLENGQFGSRIYPLIGQDFGYGTGLFYSMIPASITAIFIYVFRIPLTAAIVIQLALLFFATSLVVFFFLKRVFGKKSIAIPGAIFYITFPYATTNWYTRFAFSEIYLFLAVPLIAWGLYELVVWKNYKAFFRLFITGFVLSIFTHFTLTAFIALFALLFIGINYKSIIKNKGYIPLAIAGILVLLIGAAYYIPMLVNYGDVQIDTMKFGAPGTALTSISIFYRSFLIPSTLVTILVYSLFVAIFLKTKNKTPTAWQIFIISTVAITMVGPIFPWYLMPDFITFIQFSWRLFTINILTCTFMFCYIISRFDSLNFNNEKFNEVLIKGFVPFMLFMSTAYLLALSINSAVMGAKKPHRWVNASVNNITALHPNNGLGWGKHGDYFPTGATQEYIFSRANSKMILESQGMEVGEFANYQNLNQVSFANVEPRANVPSGATITLNIPFSLFNPEEVKLYQLIAGESFPIAAQPRPWHKGEDRLELVLGETDFDFFRWRWGSFVIISYAEGSALQNYLRENPFEFIVTHGRARATNFVRAGVRYTVDFTDVAPNTVVELPTFFYRGYELTFTADGTRKLRGMHGENGLMTVEISEAGTLSARFTGGAYLKVAHVLSITGIVLFGALIFLGFKLENVMDVSSGKSR